MILKMFKAAKETHKYRKNQKVWIESEYPNHLLVRFKWRGDGRYVSGTQDKHSCCVGEIHEVEVDEEFGNRIRNYK